MTTVNDKTDATPAIESSEFETKLLNMLTQAAETGTEIKVTENGHTLLSLTATKPQTQNPKKPFLDADHHLLISYGDIISPVDEDGGEYG